MLSLQKKLISYLLSSVADVADIDPSDMSASLLSGCVQLSNVRLRMRRLNALAFGHAAPPPPPNGADEGADEASSPPLASSSPTPSTSSAPPKTAPNALELEFSEGVAGHFEMSIPWLRAGEPIAANFSDIIVTVQRRRQAAQQHAAGRAAVGGEAAAADAVDAAQTGGADHRLTREEIIEALKEELVLGLTNAAGEGLLADAHDVDEDDDNDGNAIGRGSVIRRGGRQRARASSEAGGSSGEDSDGNSSVNENDANFNALVAPNDNEEDGGNGNDGGEGEDDDDDASGFESCSDGDEEGGGKKAEATPAAEGYRAAMFGYVKRAATAVVPEAFRKPRPIEVRLTNIRLRLDCSPMANEVPDDGEVTRAAFSNSNTMTNSSSSATSSSATQRRVLEVFISSVHARIEPEEDISGASAGSHSITKKVKAITVGEIRVLGFVGSGVSALSPSPSSVPFLPIVTVPPMTVSLADTVSTPLNLPAVASAKAAAAAAAAAALSGSGANKVARIKTHKTVATVQQEALVAVDVTAPALDTIRLCLLGLLRADDAGRSGVARLSSVAQRWQYLMRRVISRRRRARARYCFDTVFLRSRREAREGYVALLRRLIGTDRLLFSSSKEALATFEETIRFRDVIFELRRKAHAECGTTAMLYNGIAASTAAASSSSSSANNGGAAVVRHDALVDGSVLITVVEPFTAHVTVRGVAVRLPNGYAFEVGHLKAMRIGTLSASATVHTLQLSTPLPARPLVMYQTNEALPCLTFSLDTPQGSTATVVTADNLRSGGGGNSIGISNKFVDVNVVLDTLAIAITVDDLFAFGQPLAEAATHVLVAATAAERALKASSLYVNPLAFALEDPTVRQAAASTYVRSSDRGLSSAATASASPAATVTVTRAAVTLRRFEASLERIGVAVRDVAAVLISSDGSKGILTDVRCGAITATYGGGAASESLEAPLDSSGRDDNNNSITNNPLSATAPPPTTATTADAASSAPPSSSSSSVTVLLEPFSLSTEARSNTITVSPIVLRLSAAAIAAAIAAGRRLQSLPPPDLIALISHGMTAEAMRRAEEGLVGDDATTFGGLDSMSTATGASAIGGDRTAAFARRTARQRVAAANSPATRIVGAVFAALNRSRRPKRMRIEGIASIRELAPFWRRSRYPSGFVVTAVHITHDGLVDLRVGAVSISHHERFEPPHSRGTGGGDGEDSANASVVSPSPSLPLAQQQQRPRRAKDAAIVIAISTIDASLFGDRVAVSLRRLSAEAVLLTDPAPVAQIMLDAMTMNMRESSAVAFDAVPFAELRDVRAASCAGHTDASIAYANVCGQGALVESVSLSITPRPLATPVETRPTVTGDMDLALRVRALDLRCLTGPRFLPLNTILFSQVVPWVTALAPPSAIRLFMSSLTDITLTVREGRTVLTSYNGMVAVAEVCVADSLTTPEACARHQQYSSAAAGSVPSVPSSPGANPSLVQHRRTSSSVAPSTARGHPLSARGAVGTPRRRPSGVSPLSSDLAVPFPSIPSAAAAGGFGPLDPSTAAPSAATAHGSSVVGGPAPSSASHFSSCGDAAAPSLPLPLLIPKRLRVRMTNDTEAMAQTVTVENIVVILNTPSSPLCAAHLHVPRLEACSPIARMDYWTAVPPLLSQKTTVSCASVHASFVACAPPAVSTVAAAAAAVAAAANSAGGGIHGLRAVSSNAALGSGYASVASPNALAPIVPLRSAIGGGGASSAARLASPTVHFAQESASNSNNGHNHHRVAGYVPTSQQHLSLAPTSRIGKAFLSVEPTGIFVEAHSSTVKRTMGGRASQAPFAAHSHPLSGGDGALGGDVVVGLPPLAMPAGPSGAAPQPPHHDDDMDSLYGGGGATLAPPRSAVESPIGGIREPLFAAPSGGDSSGILRSGSDLRGDRSPFARHGTAALSGDEDAYECGDEGLYGPTDAEETLRIEDQTTAVDVAAVALQWHIYTHSELTGVRRCMEDLVAVFADVREPLSFTPEGHFRLTNEIGGTRRLGASGTIVGETFDLSKVRIRITNCPPSTWVPSASAAMTSPTASVSVPQLNTALLEPPCPSSPLPPLPSSGGSSSSSPNATSLVVFENCTFTEHPTSQQLSSVTVAPNAAVLFRQCVFVVPGCTVKALKRHVPSDADTSVVIYEGCTWRIQRMEDATNATATGGGGGGGGGEAEQQSVFAGTANSQRLPPIIAPPPGAANSTPPPPPPLFAEAAAMFGRGRGGGSDVGSVECINDADSKMGSIGGRSDGGGGSGADGGGSGGAALVAVDARMAITVRVGSIEGSLNVTESGPRVGLVAGPLSVASSIHSTQMPMDPADAGLSSAAAPAVAVMAAGAGFSSPCPPRVVVVTTEATHRVALDSLRAACDIGARRLDLIPAGSLALSATQHSSFVREAASASAVLETRPTATSVEGSLEAPDVHVPLSLADIMGAFAEALTTDPSPSEGSAIGGNNAPEATVLRGTLRPCPPPTADGSAASSGGRGGGGVSSQAARNKATAEALAEELQLRDTVGGSGWILDAIPAFVALEHLSVAFRVPALRVTAYLPTDLPLAALDLRELSVAVQPPLPLPTATAGTAAAFGRSASPSAVSPMTTVGGGRTAMSPSGTACSSNATTAASGQPQHSHTSSSPRPRTAKACAKATVGVVWSLLAYDHLTKGWGRLVEGCGAQLEATRSATSAAMSCRLMPLNIVASSATLRSLSFVARFLEVSRKRTQATIRGGLMGALLRELPHQQSAAHGSASPSPLHGSSSAGNNAAPSVSSSHVPDSTVAALAARWPQHQIINEVGCPIELLFPDRTTVRLRAGGTYRSVVPFAHSADHIAVGTMRRVPIRPFVDITTRRYHSAGLAPPPPADTQAGLASPQQLCVPIAFRNEDPNVLFVQRSVTYVGDGVELSIERVLTSDFTEELRVRTCCIIENHSSMHFVFGGACPLTSSLIPHPSLQQQQQESNGNSSPARGGGSTPSSASLADGSSSSATPLTLAPAQLSVPPFTRIGVPLWLLDDWSAGVALAQQLSPNEAVGHNGAAHFLGGSFRSVSQEIVSKGEASRLYTKGFDLRGNGNGQPNQQQQSSNGNSNGTAYASICFGVDRATRLSTVHLHHATAGIRNGMRFALTATFYTDSGSFDAASQRGSFVAEPDAVVYTSAQSPKERLMAVLEVVTPMGTYASAAVPLHPRSLICEEATPCKLFKVPDVVAGDEGGLASLPGLIGSWLGGLTGGAAAAITESPSSGTASSPNPASNQQQQQQQRQPDAAAVARNAVDTVTADYLQVYLMAGTDASMPVLHVAPHPDFLYLVNRTAHSLVLHPFEAEDVVAGIGESRIPTAATAYVRSGAYKLSTRDTLPSTAVSLEPQLPPSIVACAYRSHSTLVCEKLMLRPAPTAAAPCSVMRPDPDAAPPIPFKTAVVEVISPYVVANGSRTERLVIEHRARNRTSNMGGAGMLTVVEPLGVAYLSRCSHERKYVNEFRIAFASPTDTVAPPHHRNHSANSLASPPPPNALPRLTTTFSAYVTDDGIRRDFALMPLSVTSREGSGDSTSGSGGGRQRFHTLRIVRPTVTGPTELFIGEEGPPPVTIVNASRHVVSECPPRRISHASLSTLDPHLLLHMATAARRDRPSTAASSAAAAAADPAGLNVDTPQRQEGGGGEGMGSPSTSSATSTATAAPPQQQQVVRWDAMRIGFADSAAPFVVPRASLLAVKEAEARGMGAGFEAARDYSRLVAEAEGAEGTEGTEGGFGSVLSDGGAGGGGGGGPSNGVPASHVRRRRQPLYAAIKAFDCDDHLRRFILVLLPPATNPANATTNVSGNANPAALPQPLDGQSADGLTDALLNGSSGATPDADTDAAAEALAATSSGRRGAGVVVATHRTNALTITVGISACSVTLVDHPMRAGGGTPSGSPNGPTDGSSTAANASSDPNSLLLYHQRQQAAAAAEAAAEVAMVPIAKLIIGGASATVRFKRMRAGAAGKAVAAELLNGGGVNAAHQLPRGYTSSSAIAAGEAAARQHSASSGADSSFCVFDFNIENLSATDLSDVDSSSRQSVTASSRTALERCGLHGHFMGMDPPLLHSEVRAHDCAIAASPIQLSLSEKLIACMLQYSRNAVWAAGSHPRRFHSNGNGSSVVAQRGFLSRWKRPAFLRCRTVGGGDAFVSATGAPSATTAATDALTADGATTVSALTAAFMESLGEISNTSAGGVSSANGATNSIAKASRETHGAAAAFALRRSAAAIVPSPITSDATVKYVTAQSLCLGEVSLIVSWERSLGAELIESKLLSYLLNSVRRMSITIPEFRRDRLSRAHAELLRSDLVWHYINAARSQWRGIVASFGISQLSSVSEGIGFIGGKVMGLFSSAFGGSSSSSSSAAAAASSSATGADGLAQTTSMLLGGAGGAGSPLSALFGGGGVGGIGLKAPTGPFADSNTHSWLCFHCAAIEAVVRRASFEVNAEGMRSLLQAFGPCAFLHHAGARELAMALTKNTVIRRGPAAAVPAGPQQQQQQQQQLPPVTYYRLEGVQNLTSLLPLIRLSQLRASQLRSGGSAAALPGIAGHSASAAALVPLVIPRDEVGPSQRRGGGGWVEGVPPCMLSLRHGLAHSAPLPNPEGLAEFDLSAPAVAAIVLGAVPTTSAAPPLSSGASSRGAVTANQSSQLPTPAQHAEAVITWQRAYAKAFLNKRVLSTVQDPLNSAALLPSPSTPPPTASSE